MPNERQDPQRLGRDLSSCVQVILYDKAGIFSSPRVWWTFQAFGHDKCASCCNSNLITTGREHEFASFKI